MDGGALTASELALEAGVTAADGEFASRQADGRRTADAREPGPSPLLRLAARGRRDARGDQRRRRPAAHSARVPARATRRCARPASATTTSLATTRSRCSTGFSHEASSSATATRSGSGRRAALLRSDRHRHRALGRPPADVPRLPRLERRRSHLAGSLGAAILDKILAEKWARRPAGSRVVEFTPPGRKAFEKLFLAADARSVAATLRMARLDVTAPRNLWIVSRQSAVTSVAQKTHLNQCCPIRPKCLEKNAIQP